MTINESGVLYDNIQAFGFGPSAHFDGGGLCCFTNGAWTVATHSPTWVEATDGVLNDTNFTLSLSMTGPGYLDLFAFKQGALTDSARFGWDPNGYTGVIYGTIPEAASVYRQDVAQATPEPGTLVSMLLGGGLVAVGAIRRKRKHNN